jgi:alginate O-acetyltransferase complex protein AlgI
MVFSSHIFIYYFLPLTLLIYYVLPAQRNLFLLIVSYIFYGWSDPWFAPLMLLATLINYLCGKAIGNSGASPRTRKTALVLSIIGSLSLLGFFKYFTFAGRNVDTLLELFGLPGISVIEIALPVGISFYTFQSLSYTIDVYRGDAPPVRNFVDFACFVALFPQLIAGPIVRYQTIADQLIYREHTVSQFSSGVELFILGFAKKILLANSIGSAADAAFSAESPGALAAWFGVTAYAFQIYFDFSAYSDMAVGLGRMFGFEFLKNFDAPYRSESITEFWRRWHISLSTFLRDYLYIPLGGNRLGRRRTYVNLAIVMVLGGLWHGANWTFVAWGAYHGALLALERAAGKRGLYSAFWRPLRVGITFALVLFSWVLFRSPDIASAGSYLAAMFGANGWVGSNTLLHALLFTRTHVIAMAICAALIWQPYQAFDSVGHVSLPRVVALSAVFCLALVMMSVQSFNPFLYYQF